MSPRRRRLELCRRRGRVWLLTDGVRRHSGTTVADLAEGLKGLRAESPLTLNLKDSLIVRPPMVEAAPFLAALRPSAEVATALEKELEWFEAPPVFWVGNRINGSRWAWTCDGRTEAPFKWRIVPFQFAQEKSEVFSASSTMRESMTSGTVTSTVLWKDGVALETGNGDNGEIFDAWGVVSYGVSDVDKLVRAHLGRDQIGLPSRRLGEPACPACESEPYPGWEFTIRVRRPASRALIGEALGNIFKPCAEHARTGARVRFGRRSYVWQRDRWAEAA